MIHSFPQVVPEWLKTGTQRDQKDTIDNRLKTHNPKVVGSSFTCKHPLKSIVDYLKFTAKKI